MRNRVKKCHSAEALQKKADKKAFTAEQKRVKEENLRNRRLEEEAQKEEKKRKKEKMAVA